MHFQCNTLTPFLYSLATLIAITHRELSRKFEEEIAEDYKRADAVM